MARNGAGAYVLPAGSIVVDGDDATAAQHNTPLLDLQTDANTVRPIVAGGTGGNSASAARTALGLGTIATQGAGAVAVTGGTIEATAIGGTTAAAGAFTTGAFTTVAASGVITSAGAAAALVVQDTDAADGDDKAQLRVDATVAYVQGTANGKLRLSGLGSTNLTDFSARIGGAWKDLLYDGYAGDFSLGGAVTADSFIGDGSALTGIANTFFIVQETQAANTNGGTFTSGAWRTRDLNTTQINSIPTGASLASSRVTLPAGTYRAQGFAAGYRVDETKSRLYSITASATLLLGSTARADQNNYVYVNCIIDGVFTIGVSTVIELQHRCSLTNSVEGLGKASNFGERELYAQMSFEKIA
jgi:hypothetical protein